VVAIAEGGREPHSRSDGCCEGESDAGLKADNCNLPSQSWVKEIGDGIRSVSQIGYGHRRAARHCGPQTPYGSKPEQMRLGKIGRGETQLARVASTLPMEINSRRRVNPTLC